MYRFNKFSSESLCNLPLDFFPFVVYNKYRKKKER
nr:MAG TPA: hypothetical protein [Caudoviricetes sp.]